jgi:hypothetical protein
MRATCGNRTLDALNPAKVETGSNHSGYILYFRERAVSMPEWMTSWPFLIVMALILISLIGLLLFLRNKRPED